MAWNRLESKKDLKPQEFSMVEASIEGHIPVLILKPALLSRANQSYWNAALSMGKGMRKKKDDDVTTDDLELDNKKLRKLYADHVVEDWREMYDERDGKVIEVPFNKQEALGFLNSLPDDYFNKIVRFCTDVDNFRDLEEETDFMMNDNEVQELAKKSESDTSLNSDASPSQDK